MQPSAAVKHMGVTAQLRKLYWPMFMPMSITMITADGQCCVCLLPHREKGVALGERCYGACYGSLAVEFPNNLDQGPYALCTEDGMEIFNADKCLPL